MVLVYLPTKLGDFARANVGKDSSTMEHMGDKIVQFGEKWESSMAGFTTVTACYS